MWPFRKPRQSSIGAKVSQRDGEVIVDVRGQTCPGYLLSINKAVATLPAHSRVTILTTYAPCGSDVEAWCREKEYRFRDLVEGSEGWEIRVAT